MKPDPVFNSGVWVVPRKSEELATEEPDAATETPIDAHRDADEEDYYRALWNAVGDEIIVGTKLSRFSRGSRLIPWKRAAEYDRRPRRCCPGQPWQRLLPWKRDAMGGLIIHHMPWMWLHPSDWDHHGGPPPWYRAKVDASGWPISWPKKKPQPYKASEDDESEGNDEDPEADPYLWTPPKPRNLRKTLDNIKQRRNYMKTDFHRLESVNARLRQPKPSVQRCGLLAKVLRERCKDLDDETRPT